MRIVKTESRMLHRSRHCRRVAIGCSLWGDLPRFEFFFVIVITLSFATHYDKVLLPELFAIEDFTA